ncbi:MAG: STAS domain-containing protein [Phycisphaerales bacterium]|nr:MAG: STAS domain-containing protein [Phycisphaerales bacterium]
MSIEIWPEGAVLVELPAEPEAFEELENVICRVQDRGGCDVVLDFTNVTFLTSRSLAPLLRLRNQLGYERQRLLLCCVGHATRGVLSVTALDRAFEVVDNRRDALTALQARPTLVTSVQ